MITSAQCKAILEILPDGVAMVELLTNKIKFVNNEVTSLLGYSKSELVDSEFLNLFPETERSIIINHLEELEKQGNSNFHTQFLNKDGTTIPVDLNSRIVPLDEGEIILYSIKSIAKHNELLEKEEKAKIRYKNLYDSVPFVGMSLVKKGDHFFLHEVNKKALEETNNNILPLDTAGFLAPIWSGNI